MKKTTAGIFPIRKDAERFINYIHNELSIPHEDISYVYKNINGEIKEVDTSEVSSVNTKEGAVKGAKAGAVVGALAGIATVAGMIPVIGPLFVAGPLVAALGISGGLGVTAAASGTGAALGGLAGALVGMGVGEEKSKEYEDFVAAGNILVVINSKQSKEVEKAMDAHDALNVKTYEIEV